MNTKTWFLKFAIYLAVAQLMGCTPQNKSTQAPTPVTQEVQNANQASAPVNEASQDPSKAPKQFPKHTPAEAEKGCRNVWPNGPEQKVKDCVQYILDHMAK